MTRSVFPEHLRVIFLVKLPKPPILNCILSSSRRFFCETCVLGAHERMELKGKLCGGPSKLGSGVQVQALSFR